MTHPAGIEADELRISLNSVVHCKGGEGYVNRFEAKN